MAYHGLKPRFISVRIKGDSGTGVLELANQTSPTLTSLAGHSQVFSYSGQTWQYSSDGRVQSFALSNGAFLKNYIARPTAAGFSNGANMLSNGWAFAPLGSGAAWTAVARPSDTTVRTYGGCFEITVTSMSAPAYLTIPTMVIPDASDLTSEYNICFDYSVTGTVTDRQLGVSLLPYSGSEILSSPSFLPSGTNHSGTFVGRIRGSSLNSSNPHRIKLTHLKSSASFTLKITNVTFTPCQGIELTNVGSTSETNCTGFVEWLGSAPYMQTITSYYSFITNTFSITCAGRGRIKGKPVAWFAGDSVSVSDDTCGIIHYNSSGVLTYTQYGSLFGATRKATYDNFVNFYSNNIPLFEVWKTSVTAMVCKECHSYGYPAEVAADQFIRSGVLFTGSGGVIARYSGGQTIQMTGDDLLNDHGLTSKVASDLNQLTLTTVYKNNSNVGVAVAPSTALPAKYVSSGVLTNVTNNNYTVCAIYIIKDDLQTPSTSDPKIRAFLVPSASQYANAVTAANSIGTTDIPNMTQFQLPNEFMMLEPVIAGFVIVMGDGSGNATIPALNTNGFSDGIRSFKAMSNTAYSAGAVNTADASSIKVDAGGYSGALATTDTDQSLVNARVNGFGYIPAWASGQSYRIGNIVRRDNTSSKGHIWRCITANTDAVFDPTKWESLSGNNGITWPGSDINAGNTMTIDFLAADTAISIEYSTLLYVANKVEIGRIMLATNGTDVAIGHTFASTAAINVTYSAAINSGVIRLSITNNEGNSVRFKYRHAPWDLN